MGMRSVLKGSAAGGGWWRPMAAAVAVSGAVVMAGGVPATAQTVPAPPPLPEEAEPARQTLAPAWDGTGAKVCASVAGTLAINAIVVSAVAGDAGPVLIPVLQEALAAQNRACSLTPPYLQVTSCTGDHEIASAWSQVPAPEVPGAPVAVGGVVPGAPRPVGGAVDTVGEGEEAAAAQGAPEAGARDEVAAALGCQTVSLSGNDGPKSPAPTSSTAPRPSGSIAPMPALGPAVTFEGSSGAPSGNLDPATSSRPLPSESGGTAGVGTGSGSLGPATSSAGVARQAAVAASSSTPGRSIPPVAIAALAVLAGLIAAPSLLVRRSGS